MRAAVIGRPAARLASSSTVGLVGVAIAALAGGIGFVLLARRRPVTRHTVNEDSSTSRECQTVDAEARR